MDLELDETQRLLRDTVREFLEREVPFDRVRELERAGGWDGKLWARLHEHGWLGTPFPSEWGGGDGTLLEAGLLVEEIQRRAALVPAAEALAAAATLQRHGPPGRARELVQGLLAGHLTPVPALLEAGDRFGEVEAEVGSDGRLRGRKCFVDYAQAATHHLVSARRAGELGLYWVEASPPLVAAEPLHHIGRTPRATVRYDGARAEALCGAAGHEFLIRLGRTLCAVQALACMQQALERSVAYTSVREQFGRPIGTFQAVQHHAANMATDVESVRFLVYEALDALERGTDSAEQVAIAKAAASRAVPEVTMLAQQLHGGHGFIEENDLYFFTLRGKDRSLAWGTAEECLAIAAETVDRPRDWL